MLYYHGSTLLDLARPAEAIVSLNLAAGLVPGETAVGRLLPSALARAYADDGMVGEARTTLERAFFQYPDDPATVFAFTSFLYEAGDLERAERELSAFLDSGAPAPDIGVGDAALSDFRMRHLRASVRYLLGRYGDSERDARRVVETCESFGDGYLVLGDALLAQGRYEQLAALRRELAGGDGGSILISLLDASARALQGDLVGAGAILDREIASSGPHVFLERALGRLESGSTSVPLAAHALARDRTWVRV
jgi:tetratricopeptide (TPR) repeat protein